MPPESSSTPDALTAALGKTFAPKLADGRPGPQRFKVVSVERKSKRHKGQNAFTVVRIGHDSFAEPVAETFLATHVEVTDA